MRRPVVTVTIRNEQGDVLHSEKRSAFNAGIRASEDAIREIARAAHTTYEADRPSRVGDVYTRRWVSRDGRAIVATIEKEPETAMEARKTSPEPDPVEAAHKAGAGYAHEQIGSPYFLEWVHEQMAEAERMRQADPNSVIDASTPAGARKVAKNMLQQLEWDTKRELNMTTVGLEHGDAKAFYEGFTEQLRQTSTVEWLTDIILRTEEDMRGVVHEARGRRKPSWMPPPAAPAPEWESKPRGAERVSIRKDEAERSMSARRVTEKLEAKSRLDLILDRVELGKREVTFDTEGYTRDQVDRIIAAAKQRGLHASYDGRFVLVRNMGGIGETYVEPSLVPAGKETRETYDLPRAKQHRKGVDYYETASDAQKVRNHILPQYPEARVVRYELGWAVQLYKSGPYYPEPAIVPAGRETREAREAKRTPTSTMYQEAQVFINGRFQVGFTFTPSRGPEAAAREVLSLTRDGDIIEVKQGQEVWTYKVAGKGNAKRLVTVRETREAYGRRGHRRGGDDRPVTPYYSRKR